MEEYPLVQASVNNDDDENGDKDVKDDVEQKKWMKKIFLNYKPEASTEQLGALHLDNLWSKVSQMVGFFSDPSPAGGGTGDSRRVVCYPDLPIPATAAPQNREDAYMLQTNGIAKLEDPYRTANLQIARAPPNTAMIPNPKQEPRDDPYQCNVCNKSFAVPARLTRHYRTHTGERPFQCDFCDKKFGVKENLSVHRRIHTKERPYKCEVCSRAFEHSGKLHRHMRIHTGERPHACSVCNKTFIQSGQLVIHMRTHTGEKPYVCPVCDKGFTCSKQLKVHSRTHTGEKPYNCEICGKSFGYNHVLKLHQVAHYGTKVYKCTICQDTFSSKKSMETHIKTHSENQPATSSTPIEHSQSSNSSLSASIPALSPSAMSTPTSVLQYNTPEPSESSCHSDKENKISRIPMPMQQEYSAPSPIYHRESPLPPLVVPPHQSQQPCYPSPKNNYDYMFYLQPSVTNATGVNPALLAAAAAAREERTQSPTQGSTSPYEASYYHPSAATDMRNFIVYLPTNQQQQQQLPKAELPRLDHGNDIRKRVEAALAAATIPMESNSEDDSLMITPPNSHSTSPSPSMSPEPPSPPIDKYSRENLILPPRKRSHAIMLRLMQENAPTPEPEATKPEPQNSEVRYCSVIQYGRSSY